LATDLPSYLNMIQRSIVFLGEGVL